MVRALMIQGTASHVGKSWMVAGLCRLFRQEGVRVAPFKAQNMALNSFPTRDGREMGRAQVVQAEAAGVEPTVDMNPILLKPSSDRECQVIIHGRIFGRLSPRENLERRDEAWAAIAESYRSLASAFDLILIEGAGSPAELNLRQGDLVNMRVATLAEAPVLLVGDIDRGGVFASLIGTLHLLDGADRARIRGLVINKFRGDRSFLEPGIRSLEAMTGLPVFGVVPFIRDLAIPEEDGVALEAAGRDGVALGEVRIGVILLPHLANFTDFDPLRAEPGVSLRYLRRPDEIRGQDLVILPGTKNTIEDCRTLRREGFEKALAAYRSLGGPVIGVCGGFQMLGRRIEDPHGMETTPGGIDGLGFLDMVTILEREKATFQVEATPLDDPLGGPGRVVSAYEIHLGVSQLGPEARPLFRIRRSDGTTLVDGAMSADGRVWGTHLHGLFDDSGIRRDLVAALCRDRDLSPPAAPRWASWRDQREVAYDRLADLLRGHLDLAQLFALAGIVR